MKLILLVLMMFLIPVAGATEIALSDSDYNTAFTNAKTVADARWTNGTYVTGYNPGPTFNHAVWIRDYSEWGAMFGYYYTGTLSAQQKKDADVLGFTRFLDKVGTYGIAGVGTQNILIADGSTDYTITENTNTNIDHVWQPIIVAYNYYIYYNDSSFLSDTNTSGVEYYTLMQDMVNYLAVVKDTNDNNMTEREENFDWGDDSQTTGYIPVQVDETYDTIGMIRALRIMSIFAELKGDISNQTKYSNMAGDSVNAMDIFYNETWKSYEYNKYLDGQTWTGNHTSNKGLVTDFWSIHHNITNNETRTQNIINSWKDIRNNIYPSVLGFPIINGSVCPSKDAALNGCNANVITRGQHQNHGDWFWYDHEVLMALLDRHDPYAYTVYDGIVKTASVGLKDASYEYHYLDGTITPIGGYTPSNDYQATATGFGRNVIEHVFGIQPKEPGFSKIWIRPFFKSGWNNESINTTIPGGYYVNYTYNVNTLHHTRINVDVTRPNTTVYYEIPINESLNGTAYVMKDGVNIAFTYKNISGNGLVVEFSSTASEHYFDIGNNAYWEDHFDDSSGIASSNNTNIANSYANGTNYILDEDFNTGIPSSGFSYNTTVYSWNNSGCVDFTGLGAGTGAIRFLYTDMNQADDISIKLKMNVKTIGGTQDNYAGAVLTANNINWPIVGVRGYARIRTGASNTRTLDESVAWGGTFANTNLNQEYWIRMYRSGTTIKSKIWDVGSSEGSWDSTSFTSRSDPYAGFTTELTTTGYFDDMQIWVGENASTNPSNITSVVINLPDGKSWSNLTYSSTNSTYNITDGLGVQQNNIANGTAITSTANNITVYINNTDDSIDWYRVSFTTGAPVTSTMTISANAWGIFNNWTFSMTFAGIAANESNDVCYSHYNVSSGLWESYYVGYTWNANYELSKDASVMGFFDAQTDITSYIITPANTELYIGWNMLGVQNSFNRTISEVIADIGANCSEVWYFNTTTGAYSNTTTHNIQPNQGFLAYLTQNMTWTRSAM